MDNNFGRSCDCHEFVVHKGLWGVGVWIFNAQDFVDCRVDYYGTYQSGFPNSMVLKVLILSHFVGPLHRSGRRTKSTSPRIPLLEGSGKFLPLHCSPFTYSC